MDVLKAVEEFAILLPVVKESIEEDGLTKAEALSQLRNLMGPEEQPYYVVKAIRRLEGADDFDLALIFGHECVKALEFCEQLEQAD